MVVITVALAQEEVVVEAPERSLEAETSAVVTVVPIDERLPEGADLGAVVGSVPGVALRRLGGIADLSTVSIRGSTERQVVVYIDGMPLNPDGVGAVDLSELPVGAFERVEVYRGNGPVGLGGTAMGGAVNLVTTDKDVTAASALVGSQRTARIQGVIQRPLGDVGQLWFSARALSTSGRFRYFVQGAPLVTEDDDWAMRTNNDARLGNLMGRVRLGNGPVRFSLFEAFGGREAGVPGFSGAPLAEVRSTTVQSLTSAQLDVDGELPFLLRTHLLARNDGIRDPAAERVGDGDIRSLTWGLTALGRASTAPWWRGTWSIQWRIERVKDQGHRLVGSAELGLWLRRGPVRVVPAVMLYDLRSQGVGESLRSQVLPRLGAQVLLSRSWQIKANIGRTIRAPDLIELFGNRGPLVGRPDLRPEQGVFADLAVRHQGEDLVFEGALFANEAVDLITYVQNAQGAAVPANLGRTGIHGVEAALQLTGVRWLDSQTNLTVQRSINRSEDPIYRGKPLPRQPVVALDQRLGFVWRSLRLGYGLSFTTGVRTDALGQGRQPPRALHTLFSRADVGGGWQLTADLQNVTNTRTQQVRLNPLDPDSPRGPAALVDYIGYPLPGRTLLVGLRYVAGR